MNINETLSVFYQLNLILPISKYPLRKLLTYLRTWDIAIEDNGDESVLVIIKDVLDKPVLKQLNVCHSKDNLTINGYFSKLSKSASLMNFLSS